MQGSFSNILYTNDNLFVLNGLNSESVDLIYLDPPFNTKRLYSAPIGSKLASVSFRDMWSWGDVDEAYLDKLVEKHPSLVSFIGSIDGTHSKAMKAYITYMAQRIIEMHRVLKPTGSFYLHCDAHASHYLKVVLDQIFGKHNFKNEIIWHYGGRGGKAKSHQFARNSDTILFYTKSKQQAVFFKQYITTSTDIADWPSSKIDEQGKYFHTAPRGHYTDMSIKQLAQKGRIYRTKTGSIRIKYFHEHDQKYVYSQKLVGNVWNDIGDAMHMSKREKTNYPTQKPLALLKRIIKASSRKGGVVLDPFCGCATTCVAAQQLGRRWIGIDIEKKAAQILVQRLEDDAGIFKDFINISDPPRRTDIEIEPVSSAIKRQLYEEQKRLCNGCGTKMLILNLEIDHKIPKSRGGDYYENYQLLCSNCNRVKGNRPMEYLLCKIRARKRILNRVDFG